MLVRGPLSVVGESAEQEDRSAVELMTIGKARELALSLPESLEQDHHGIPSWRVRGKIFATVPDREHLRVMVDEHDIRAAVAENPAACEEFWWGSRLACVVVDLRSAPREIVVELLRDAWRRKAPRRLLDEVDGVAWCSARGLGEWLMGGVRPPTEGLVSDD